MIVASKEQIRTTIETHLAAVGAADASALADLYTPDARLHDPAGGSPVTGRTAIEQHFAGVLTEQRTMELVMVAITDHHAAFHFRATPADGPTREVIDTMTFDDQAMITSMQAYAS